MSPETNRFIRFVATGGINTGFGYASYAALVLTGMPLWLAVCGSTGLAILSTSGRGAAGPRSPRRRPDAGRHFDFARW